jgi:hypothetical protein
MLFKARPAFLYFNIPPPFFPFFSQKQVFYINKIFIPSNQPEFSTEIRFQGLTAASMKMVTFWNAVLCNLLGSPTFQKCLLPASSGRPTCFHVSDQFLVRGLNITLKTEAASIFVTSVNSYQTTRHRIPEDSHLLSTEMLRILPKSTFLLSH